MTSNRWTGRNEAGVPGSRKPISAVFVLVAVTAFPATAADLVTVPVRVVHELGRDFADPLSLPTDVAVASDGVLYVVDSGNNRIVVFDSAGRRTNQFGRQGSDDGQLQDPVGIGIAPDNSIYVADRGNKRLVQFSANGSFIASIPLQEGGQDVVPIDVAVSADGNELFVTANNSHRIVVFSTNGEQIRGWGGEGSKPGQFRFPATLALAEGVLYVVDVLNARIQTFDTNGDNVQSFGKLGAGPGTFFRPKGVAIDAAGRVYVSDSYLGVVQVFAADGKYLHAIGEDGVPTRFDNPVGMATLGDRLVLTQMLPHTVLVLEPEPET